MYARRVRVPGGSKFYLAPGTIYLCWNLTGTWCLRLNLLKIAFFSIHDRGGGDVWCYNLPSSGFHLLSSIKIGLGLLYIWSSGGGGPLCWVFLEQWYYLPHLQWQSFLPGGGILVVAISLLVKFSSLPQFIALWWTLYLILLQGHEKFNDFWKR